MRSPLSQKIECSNISRWAKEKSSWKCRDHQEATRSTRRSSEVPLPEEKIPRWFQLHQPGHIAAYVRRLSDPTHPLSSAQSKVAKSYVTQPPNAAKSADGARKRTGNVRPFRIQQTLMMKQESDLEVPQIYKMTFRLPKAKREFWEKEPQK